MSSESTASHAFEKPQRDAREVYAPHPIDILSLPVLSTLVTTALAAVLGTLAWQYYFGLPATRDGVVRANVITMAPEVAGRIVELHVIDNQYVRKGELLLVIDPTNYSIAVRQSSAAVQQAEASLQSAKARIGVQQATILSSRAQKDREEAALVFAQEQATRYETLAKDGSGSVQLAQQFHTQLQQQQAALRAVDDNLTLSQRQLDLLKAEQLAAEANVSSQRTQLDQAQTNLTRTRILAPVDGFVTNLLSQAGDYATVGTNTISVVDSRTFWVDGYFEETHIPNIRPGAQVTIRLLGHTRLLHGHVDSIARAINVPNAEPNNQGVATVNPVFTWVRLAQRIPVRIHIDDVDSATTLVAGMTATLEIQNAGTPSLAK